MEPSRQRAQLSSSVEDSCFNRIRDACCSNDPKAALNSLVAWLGRCCAGSEPSSVKEFAAGLGDDDLAEQLASLQEAVASRSTDWSGAELYSAVDRARRKLQTTEVSSG